MNASVSMFPFFSARKISLLAEHYHRLLPLAFISGIFFFLWLFVLFFVPPVIAADILVPHTYLAFYAPLFLSTVCLATFALRHLRRGLWIALCICGFFALQQLHIFHWWHLPVTICVLVGVEYLLTQR